MTQQVGKHQKIIAQVDQALNIAYALEERQLSERITEQLFDLRASLEKSGRIDKLRSLRLARELQDAVIDAGSQYEYDAGTDLFTAPAIIERSNNLPNLWNGYLRGIVSEVRNYSYGIDSSRQSTATVPSRT